MVFTFCFYLSHFILPHQKSDAICQNAIEAGTRVTDDEVAIEVESIKQSYHSDDLDKISKKQMEAIISSFRSEEDYWESVDF